MISWSIEAARPQANEKAAKIVHAVIMVHFRPKMSLARAQTMENAGLVSKCAPKGSSGPKQTHFREKVRQYDPIRLSRN